MTIEAKIIVDSISEAGIRLTTMQLKYPRFIHSEVMTHRMFSRNASSSRAIPVKKMIEEVQKNPAMPIHWGKDQPGMQAKEECNNPVDMLGCGYEETFYGSESAWLLARVEAVAAAEAFAEAGYHKQIVNRLLEPFAHITTLVTATEWDNFFKLRLHGDAQPEIHELARCMKEAMDGSTPKLLRHGEWHTPYVPAYDADGNPSYYDDPTEVIKCSVARCARVTHLNHDGTNPVIEKDVKLHDDLVEAGHMSPLEHIATPMKQTSKYVEYDGVSSWLEEGETHIDKEDNVWSNNFRGWIQYRALVENK